jgi:hypothetical protein
MAEVTSLGLAGHTEAAMALSELSAFPSLLAGHTEAAMALAPDGSAFGAIWQNPAFRAAPSYPQYPSWRRPDRVIGPV